MNELESYRRSAREGTFAVIHGFILATALAFSAWRLPDGRLLLSVLTAGVLATTAFTIRNVRQLRRVIRDIESLQALP